MIGQHEGRNGFVCAEIRFRLRRMFQQVRIRNNTDLLEVGRFRPATLFRISIWRVP